MTIIIQKKNWRDAHVILKMTDKATIHSPYFLVYNGKTYFAPKGYGDTKESAIQWANHKCLELWNADHST